MRERILPVLCTGILLLGLHLPFPTCAVSNDAAPVDLLIVDGTFNIDQVARIAVNDAGEIWVSGFRSGSPLGGLENAILIRYGADGSERWLASLVGFGGSSVAEDVELDGADNAYVVADEIVGVQDTTIFTEILTSKVTPTGSIAWQRRLMSDGNRNQPFGVAADPSGNSIVVGITNGELEPGGADGGNDAFMASYDTDGNLQWIRQFGTAGSDLARGAAFDSAGNIYVVGTAQDGLFGETGLGGGDIFLSRFDGDGNHLWTRLVGTPRNNDEGWDIKVVDDTIFIAGWAKDTCSCATSDAYVASFDLAGNLLWENIFGGSLSGEQVSGVAVGSTMVYAVGETFQDIDDNVNSGTNDLMLLVYDRATGTKVDSFLYGSAKSDAGFSAVVDSADRLILGGETGGTFLGRPNANFNGTADLLVMRLDFDRISGNLAPPGDLATGDRFGDAVAVDGNLIAVGVPFDDNTAGTDAGRVVIYRIEGGMPVMEAEIGVPDGFSASRFGAALALFGNTLVIGAPGDATSAKGPGALEALQAAIFTRATGGWTLQQTLKGSGGGAGDEFASAVDLDGQLLAIGAPGDAENETEGSGAVYLYEFDGDQFVQLTKRKMASPVANARLGSAVGVGNGKVVAGATGGMIGGQVTGAAMLYERIGSNLQLIDGFNGSQSESGDGFGGSVVFLDGATIAVGADGEDGLDTDSGAVYLYDTSGSTVTEIDRLEPPDLTAGDRFGTAVAGSRGTLAAGAPGAAGGGAAYRFDQSFRSIRIQAPAGQTGFGQAIGVSGDLLVTGAPGTSSDVGAANFQLNQERLFRSGFE